MARRPKPRQPLTDSQWRLVAAHLSLASYFAGRWFGRADRHYQDAYSACVDGLMVAAGKYEPERNLPFPRLARWWILSHLSMYRAKLTRRRLAVFCEQPEVEEHPCRFPGPVRQAIARELMEVCRRVLDARLWKVLYRRHILGEEQQAIAVDLGVNRSRVSQLERQAIERVREQLPHLVGVI